MTDATPTRAEVAAQRIADELFPYNVDNNHTTYSVALDIITAALANHAAQAVAEAKRNCDCGRIEEILRQSRAGQAPGQELT